MRRLIPLLLLLAATCASQAWSTPRRKFAAVMRMEATAFSQHARPTASGALPHAGIVAADPAVLPLGSRIRITGAGSYNGTYTVADTGSRIVGKHIDIYCPTLALARRFGRRLVLVRVIGIRAGRQ